MTVQQRNIVCQEVVELVTAYLEDALSPRERDRLERHLEMCPMCTQYLRQIRTTIETVGQITTEDLTPEMLTTLLGVFEAWKEQVPGEPSGV